MKKYTKMNLAIFISALAFIATAPHAQVTAPEADATEKTQEIQKGKPDTLKPGLNRWVNSDGTYGAVQNDTVGLGRNLGPGSGGPQGDGGRR